MAGEWARSARQAAAAEDDDCAAPSASSGSCGPFGMHAHLTGDARDPVPSSSPSPYLFLTRHATRSLDGQLLFGLARRWRRHRWRWARLNCRLGDDHVLEATSATAEHLVQRSPGVGGKMEAVGNRASSGLPSATTTPTTGRCTSSRLHSGGSRSASSDRCGLRRPRRGATTRAGNGARRTQAGSADHDATPRSGARHARTSHSDNANPTPGSVARTRSSRRLTAGIAIAQSGAAITRKARSTK